MKNPVTRITNNDSPLMDKTVLVVDDEPDVVTYLTTILKYNGFTPLSADSAHSGLETVKKTKPDLILLDIMMPKESGISMYTQLKEDKRFRDIPVVVISGVAQAKEFNFRDYVSDKSVPSPDEYLEKPIQVEQFLKVVKRLTGNPSSLPKNRTTSDAG